MIYLGLDASTQSLTAILLEVDGARRSIVGDHSFTYDDALPQYGTTHGVLRNDDPSTVVSPPLMWAEALDVMMAALVERWPAEMRRLTAISGAAQQHGSVYLNDHADSRLASLSARLPIASQLADILSRPVAPIWMDSSASQACREIGAALGGDHALARRTGSRAFERFTGPQIRAFAQREPGAYAETRRIHLVSSFLASLLTGAPASIDRGDASGTNLMDLRTGQWWPEALEATADGLRDRLPTVVASSTVVGTLGGYWRERYRLPEVPVVAWTGDNPSSLIGTGIVREGQLAVSLGTSDTIFGAMRQPRVSANGTGHVFASPTGGFMGMTVFKNGSLARERVRDAYGLDWPGFSAALRSTPVGNGGGLLLPWFDPEITPHVAVPGAHRHNLDAADAAANVRAVVEAQMMALANHSAWMGVRPAVIYATGGASANIEILQVMADMFDADVLRQDIGNSACLGAALRAWHGERLAAGESVTWEEVAAGVGAPSSAPVARPIAEYVNLYADLKCRYAEFEQSQLGHG